MWKFIVDVVHDFVSSLQPDVSRGFLHVSNVFLLIYQSACRLRTMWKCWMNLSVIPWFYITLSCQNCGHIRIVIKKNNSRLKIHLIWADWPSNLFRYGLALCCYKRQFTPWIGISSQVQSQVDMKANGAKGSFIPQITLSGKPCKQHLTSRNAARITAISSAIFHMKSSGLLHVNRNHGNWIVKLIFQAFDTVLIKLGTYRVFWLWPSVT